MRYPRYWRIRIRNAADSSNALVISSYPGDDNPYLVEPPSGEGESFDPITGEPTSGSYSVRVSDPQVSANTRVITSQLADIYARQQLLSRKAFVDYSSDGTTWTTLVAAYVTTIRMITAIVFEISIGQSRRIEATRTIFKEATALFPGVTSVIGGPVYGGFINDDFLPDHGGWKFEVDEDTAVHTKLALVEGFDPRKYDGTFGSTSTAIADFTNDWARNFFQATEDYSASDIQGYFPGLRARLEPVLSGDAVTLTPLARPATLGGVWYNPTSESDRLTGFNTSQLYLPKVGLADDGTTVAFDPAIGTQYFVWVYAVAISDKNPLHYYGHPVDLWELLRQEAGIPYDDTVLPALKELIGPTVRLALRITESYKLADFDQKVIYGPFRLSSRIEDGKRVLFSTSVVDNAAPTETIDIDSVRGTKNGLDGTQFDLDESTIVTALTLKSKRIIQWSSEEADQPEIDSLISREAYPQSLENSDDDVPPGADHDVEIGDIPGMVWVHNFGPIDLTKFLSKLGYELFERFGRGAVMCELPCTPDIEGKLGEEELIDLPHMPGSLVGESPVTQRGIAPLPFQIISRTEQVEGSFLKLVNSISAESADDLVPEFDLGVGVIDEDRYVNVNITNAEDLGDADLNVRTDYYVGPTVPTGEGAYWDTILAEFLTTPTFSFSVGPFEEAATVWIRQRGETPGFRPGEWTAWQGITLGAVPGDALTDEDTDPLFAESGLYILVEA